MDSQKDLFVEVFNSINFQKIKDHPNILIAAHFWEEERYHAAKVCYKFMRAIDDLIDNYKAGHKTIAEEEKNDFEANVNAWLNAIITADKSNPLNKELIDTIETFHIPLWPLEAFAKSMIYDINNDSFPSLNSFLTYSQGASVAPASVFVHLCGLTKKDGKLEMPSFDVKRAATPCAIFSYLVHIIRDFRKDQLNNLNYFAEDIITSNGLTKQDLANIARGKEISNNFRSLIKTYYIEADKYRQITYDMIREIRPLVEPRYQLSLDIIFDLYLMVFERIDTEKGTFTTEELNPSYTEIRERVFKTIMNYSEN